MEDHQAIMAGILIKNILIQVNQARRAYHDSEEWYSESPNPGPEETYQELIEEAELDALNYISDLPDKPNTTGEDKQ